MTISDILRRNRRDIALVIGNGVHRYGPRQVNSWEDLLLDLAHRNGVDLDKMPAGASATEVYDVIELRAGGRSGELAKEFCDLMRDWQVLRHHEEIMEWSGRHAAAAVTLDASPKAEARELDDRPHQKDRGVQTSGRLSPAHEEQAISPGCRRVGRHIRSRDHGASESRFAIQSEKTFAAAVFSLVGVTM